MFTFYILDSIAKWNLSFQPIKKYLITDIKSTFNIFLLFEFLQGIILLFVVKLPQMSVTNTVKGFAVTFPS